MRKLAKGGNISPRQEAAASGTQSSSDNGAPQSVKRHPNNTVCLPVLSENKKLLWVYLSEIDLQPDCVAELDKAFARFPYLTYKQTTALAQRCSMHPDQVKLWFMARRVLYGISWDFKDIREVRNKFKSSPKNDDDDKNEERMDGEMENGGEKKNQKDNEIESGVKEEARANEQKPNGEKGRKAKGLKTSTPKKQKGGTMIVKGRKKRVRKPPHAEKAADDEGKMDISENKRLTVNESSGANLTRSNNKQIKPPVESDPLLGASSQLKPPIQTPQTVPVSENQTHLLDRADSPCNVPNMTPLNSSIMGTTEALAGLKEELRAEATDLNMVTDVEKLKELIKINTSLDTGNNPPAPITQGARKTDKRTRPTRIFKNPKTQAQVKMMKKAFSQCQYPSSEQYTQLSKWIGISRNALVQWYGDMRYSIKRGKPRWMNQEEYSQVLTNILYRQYMNSMSKFQQGLSSGDEAWIASLNENSSEDKKM